MEASTSNFHILLEFPLSTQVKPGSASGEVWGGGGKKSENFADVINGWPLREIEKNVPGSAYCVLFGLVGDVALHKGAGLLAAMAFVQTGTMREERFNLVVVGEEVFKVEDYDGEEKDKVRLWRRIGIQPYLVILLWCEKCDQ